MRSCPSCGATLHGNSQFCPACGGSMTLVCPACTSQVDPLWHFCPVCSASLSRQCPSCGALVSVSASFCDACGWPLDAAPRREAARAKVTVLFVVAQAVGEPVRTALNDRLAALSEAAKTWGGRVQRMPGSRIRVVFGLPEAPAEEGSKAGSETPDEAGAGANVEPSDGDADRAIRAAADLIASGTSEGSALAVTVRAGLATGEAVLASPVGQDPMVAGPVVNLAASLADAAKPGRVLASEATYLAAGAGFRFGPPTILAGDEWTDGTVVARRLLLSDDDDGREDDSREANANTGSSQEMSPPASEGSGAEGAVAAPAEASEESESSEDDAVEADSEKDRVLQLENQGDEEAAAGNGDSAVSLYVESLGLARVYRAMDADRARLCVKVLSLATGEDAASSAASDPQGMEALVAEGLEAAADEETKAWLLALRGACAELWSGGEDPVSLAERLDSAEAARSASETLDSPDLQAFVGRTLDWLYWTAGDYASAIENARWQLGVADRVGSPDQGAELVVRSAFTILCIQGRYAEVSELARRAQILASESGPHARMHATFLTIGANYYRGRWAELLPELESHMEAMAEDPDSRCPFVRGGAALGALALAQMGYRDRASEVASRVPSDDGTPGMVDGILARFAVASGDPGAGREMAANVLGAADEPEAAIAMIEALASLQEWSALREFVPSARQLADGMAVLEPVCERAEGLAEAATGNRWRALESLRASLGAFESLSVPFEAARTREFLAAIALPEEARDLLENAAASYERLGAAAYAERARRSLYEISSSAERGDQTEDWPQASSGGSYGF